MSEPHHVAPSDDRGVTAVDVAEDFVATKLGLVGVIASVFGGHDFRIEALDAWASESPVMLDDSDEAVDARMDRANEICLSMMRAIGRQLLLSAEMSEPIGAAH